MKKKIIYYITALALLFNACGEDFFDQKNLFEKDLDNYYANEKDVDEALIGAYSCLALDEGIGHPILIANIKSDDCFAGGGTNDIEGNAIDQFQNPKEDIFLAVYNRTYQGIFRVNTLLENFDNAVIENETVKKQKLGEAHFLRAYFYFRLAQIFGEVPLDLNSTLEYLPKATANEIYAQISSDLSKAIENLPATPYAAPTENADNTGRVSKWAAEALMARVFLFYTGFYQQATLPTADGGSVTKEQVLAWVEDCIANSGHDLLPDFRSIWPFSFLGDEGIDDKYALANGITFAGDGNKETVFAVKYSNEGGYGNPGRLAYANQLSLYTSVRGGEYAPFGQGWGIGNVNSALATIYENGDIRKESTILDQASDITGYKWNADNNNHETGMYNKKYSAVVVNRNGESVGMYYHLFPSSNIKNMQLWNMQDDIIIRFADVLLMAAELGSPNAQTYFDKVRNRAFAPGTAPAVTVSLNAIKQERRRELALEGLRYYDLLRWGDAETAINASNGIPVKIAGVDSEYSVSFSLERAFSPLPESQIRVSQGKLVQNPAW